MVEIQKLLYVACGLAFIGWLMILVAAADGPYQGWFKYSYSLYPNVNLVEKLSITFGWKGIGGQACVTYRGFDYGCSSIPSADYTNNSDFCFMSGLQAAIGFTIMALLLFTPVLVSLGLTTFKKGPPQYHLSIITMGLTLVVILFVLLAWTISLGVVFNCGYPVTLTTDHNPPLLIVAMAFLCVVIFVQHVYRSQTNAVNSLTDKWVGSNAAPSTGPSTPA